MSDVFWVNFWTSLPGTLLALGTLIGVLIAAWQARGIRRDMNGHMHRLIRTEKRESFKEGKAAEQRNPTNPHLGGA